MTRDTGPRRPFAVRLSASGEASVTVIAHDEAEAAHLSHRAARELHLDGAQVEWEVESVEELDSSV